jgi:hypothetical protein
VKCGHRKLTAAELRLVTSERPVVHRILPASPEKAPGPGPDGAGGPDRDEAERGPDD